MAANSFVVMKSKKITFRGARFMTTDHRGRFQLSPLTASFLLGCLMALFLPAMMGTTQAQGLEWFREELTIHEKATTSGGPQGANRDTTATIYVSRRALRRSSSDGVDSIFRFDTQKIVTIDNKKKSYSEVSFDDLQKRLNDSFKAMDNKEGGEDAKQAMEAMKKMFGGIGDSVKVTKQGAGEKIAGYATNKYDLEMGMLKMQMWCAPDLRMPATYYDSFKMRMPKNPMFDMTKLYDEMKKLDGYPVKQIHTMNMMGVQMTTTTEVTGVEKGSIPASTFDVPAGYKLESSKM